MKIWLTFMCCIIGFCLSIAVTTNAQDASLLPPPAWNVGDWWVVETQMYDDCTLTASSRCTPGWLPEKLQWRFHVDALDRLEGEAYFVVSIHSPEKKRQKGMFRVWFRVSDRFIGQYERTYSIGANPTLHIDRRTFDPSNPMPLVTGYFPWFPITIPIFAVAQDLLVFDDHLRPSERIKKYSTISENSTQEITAGDQQTIQENIAPALKAAKGNLTDSSRLVIIGSPRNYGYREQQYWHPDLPWYIYAEWREYFESQPGTFTPYRRCWLVENGND